MYGLQGFFSKIVLIFTDFKKNVRIFKKMYGFFHKNLRNVRIFFSKIVRIVRIFFWKIVRISSENERIFVQIFSKKFWPPWIGKYKDKTDG